MAWDIALQQAAEHFPVRSCLYILFGYLSGSILFARIFGWMLKGKDVACESADKNPGTANAFLYGGFWCGFLTLCGDLGKGFFPVWLYLRETPLYLCGPELAFILAAPVVGHILPFFGRYRGGKGIAVTFGCLLGLAPEMKPVLVLAFLFLFFSLVVRVTPHYDRTLWTYRCAAAGMFLCVNNKYIIAAFLLTALAVNANLRFSDEKREKCQVNVLWKH